MSYSSPGSLGERSENMLLTLRPLMIMNVHSSIIHTSPQMKPDQHSSLDVGDQHVTHSHIHMMRC